MIKKIFASHAARQLLGALAGMTVAALVYVLIEYTSDMNVTGLLVEPGVITESAGNVRINDPTVDDGTLRRITSRADAVAKALEQAGSETPAVTATPMNERADERRQARQFVTQHREQAANATTYQMDPNAMVITEKQRLDIRAARIGDLPASVGTPSSSTVVPLTFDNPAEDDPETPLHPGAPAVQSGTTLPSSGFGLNILVLSALALTAYRGEVLRRRRASAFARTRLG